MSADKEGRREKAWEKGIHGKKKRLMKKTGSGRRDKEKSSRGRLRQIAGCLG
jgi:hypothetical protein